MSARPDFKGDFMGFTYGTDAEGKPVHSSDLGIVRVSDGSRFNENLLPTIQDKTVQVPGGDGTYYFGSYYTQRQFTINYAFDDLTEEGVKRLKSHFGDKKIHDLVFDERPDRIYSAKVTGTATIKHIPFDSSGKTIYKGEGSIQFTCYYPFARAVEPKMGGKNEGDIPVPFVLTISGKGSISVDGHEIKWNLPEGVSAELNTRTGLVVDANKDLYNKYVTGNLTAKIPVGEEAPAGAVFYCEYI